MTGKLDSSPMVETLAAECTIQVIEAERERPGSEFKPLTSGQLLLKTRHKSDQQRALLDDDADGEQDGGEDADPGRECFLSKFLAASMTLLVCCFIYFVVLQRWFLRG